MYEGRAPLTDLKTSHNRYSIVSIEMVTQSINMALYLRIFTSRFFLFFFYLRQATLSSDFFLYSTYNNGRCHVEALTKIQI